MESFISGIARVYVVAHFSRKIPTTPYFLRALTGWELSECSRFIRQAQEEFERARLLKKRKLTEDRIEEVRQKEHPDEPDYPMYFYKKAARYCPICGNRLVPKRYDGPKQWESQPNFDSRQTCGIVCSGKLRGMRQVGRKRGLT